MLDITRDKPIKVAVRVAVPVRDHPKVINFFFVVVVICFCYIYFMNPLWMIILIYDFIHLCIR